MRPRALLAAAAIAASVGGAAPATAAPRATCMEDAPCWNWATMGDHRRGVGGLVVGPCRFQRLVRSGAIQPAPMKGDKLAMRLNCPSLAARSAR